MQWLVEETPGSPEHNMAVDSALLDRVANGIDQTPTVRIYRWDRPAVSIGRLQKEEPVRQVYPALPIVRRPTGGRAVVHGDDLTISVVLRLGWLPQDSQSILYSHQIIMAHVEAALAAIGLDVCAGGCPIRNQNAIINCFDLAASCDIIESSTGRKLVGSAQRREGDALLQQMSIPNSVVPEDKLFLTHLRHGFHQTFANY